MDPAATTIGVEILQWISQYGYIILLPLFMVQGTVAGFASGVLISLGVLELVPILALYIGGIIIVDTVLYQLAKSGSSLLTKLPFASQTIKRVHEHQATTGPTPVWVKKFKEHYFSLVFFTRVSPIPVASQIVVMVAGALKLSFQKVYPPIIIGQPIWSGIVVALGYYLGTVIQDPQEFFSEAGIVMLVAVILIGLYRFYLHDQLRRKLDGFLSTEAGESGPDIYR